MSELTQAEAVRVMPDDFLVLAIREALEAANADVYGDGGNTVAFAALAELLRRLHARPPLT